MEFTLHGNIAELKKGSKNLTNVSDCLDVLVNADYQGARSVIIHSTDLPEQFYDLKTRLAGDILQKFSNYRMRLAIIGDWSGIESKSLSAFIRECNRGSQIFFVECIEQALSKFTQP